ncbi:hypothetical protein MTR67_030778 [Solanum verrucosum]|uniref:Uncharacterized protein n=1 Tax=Solanum verrucosum TaxID=315347 RepID=A0AAF0U183_SOLVR|nr:hypothetical protein MTR67_030778 [Solanum verrucosum]
MLGKATVSMPLWLAPSLDPVHSGHFSAKALWVSYLVFAAGSVYWDVIFREDTFPFKSHSLTAHILFPPSDPYSHIYETPYYNSQRQNVESSGPSIDTQIVLRQSSESQLRELALANVGAIHRRADLSKKLSVLTPEELRDLVCRKPNEQIMWDESLVPSINYTGEGCLALPKLNLQFLTLHDYFLRNFNLFRLESTYEIREDIQEAVPHLLAYINNEGEPAFRGWSRMAVPVKEFKITEVEQPNIGEVKPAAVTAEVTFSISSY